ncbi:hypothetical protein B5F74_03150 [Collinsella sp. An271]|uniref:hypothetical protein n=1 Tax=Collinsella sp. An271 TaxID=1965616 RepID=UPI000B38059A|nr:hypothetical protein [Collinsella sp. An271]OUO61640.1 hypothetical protein B5F74_03150 [Collinsella sp. An271]
MPVIWPDGRSWRVDAVVTYRSYGRSFLGTLVERWDVKINGRIKTVWCEHDRFFVERKKR